MTELNYKEGPRTQEIKVTRREWDKLMPAEYLNDQIILFWLKFLQYYGLSTPEKQFDPNSIYIWDP